MKTPGNDCHLGRIQSISERKQEERNSESASQSLLGGVFEGAHNIVCVIVLKGM